MALRKILPADLAGKGVTGLPDTPNLSAQEMQKKLDELGREVIPVIFNENVDAQDLKNTEVDGHLASRQNPHEVSKDQVGLGSVDNTSDQEKPVSTFQQAALDQKVDKETGKGLSQNDYTDLDKDEVAKVKDKADKSYTDTQLALKADKGETYTKTQVDTALAGKADVSSVLRKDNTEPFTPTGDYQPATKKYADDLAMAAGAVTSVFGRTGAVTAQAGDYTAEQITESETRKFVSPSEKDKWNKGGAKRGYNITLAKSGWKADDTGLSVLSGMYIHPIAIGGVVFEATQEVSLAVPPSTMQDLPSGISTANVNGTVYAVTEWPPESDITVQIKVGNVEMSGPVLGGES